MTKPSLPKGMRDLTSEVLRKRNYIFSIIKNVFEIYSFEPLETPAMENLETLMGKSGEEGDRLIFKIMNNGLINPKNIENTKAGFEKILEGENTPAITERALKYDLTIPFARYVAMNHNKLTFPFRRYQVQPVWRADRPQKGRYREFTQFDADVVGNNSLFTETELAAVYHEVFTQLKISDYRLLINNRKILAALAEKVNATEKLTDITIAIDKLDKIGIDKVEEELLERGLNKEQIAIINTYISITGSNEEKIIAIKNLLGKIKTGIKGIEEIEFVLENIKKYSAGCNAIVDFTLARGLNYYTGTIFEVKAPEGILIGSIGGGGRYDNLTGLFGVPGIPGVGISFGVDRIYDVLEELKLFPENLQVSTKALFFNMGETESQFAFGVMQQLRNKGLACELYHESAKITKQFAHAEKKNIPYVVIIGSKEIEQNYCLVKNLSTSLQEVVLLERLFDFFTK